MNSGKTADADLEVVVVPSEVAAENKPAASETTPEPEEEEEMPGSPFRTAENHSLPPAEVLKILRQGNARFVGKRPAPKPSHKELRTALAEEGPNPLAIVIGCADSRCPEETLFDAQPGDLFVLRNAGNMCAYH